MAGAAEGTVFRGFAALAAKERFQPYTYTPPPLGAEDVEIRVTHNGLCHTDIHMRDNDWGATTFPLIAGHEVVGIVEAVGSDVTNLKKGDRVGYGWMRDSCRSCYNCVKGEENLCIEGYEGIILDGNTGGFQELLRAPADFAFKIPDALDSVSAAPLLCAGITMYSPLRSHITRPGMRVGIIGIGGLGHLGIQIARKMGATVAALSTSSSKEKESLGFGAHEFYLMGQKEPTNLPANKKFDLIINTTHVTPPDFNYQTQMEMLQRNGTLVLCGVPPNSKVVVDLPHLIMEQKKVAGSIVGGRRDVTEMLEFCAAQGIKPLCQVMKLSEVNEAMDIVLANKARYRIVLVANEVDI